jgi:hypothetical protein
VRASPDNPRSNGHVRAPDAAPPRRRPAASHSLPFCTEQHPKPLPPGAPLTPSACAILSAQNAIENSLTYDKCLQLQGAERASCQLDKALANVGRRHLRWPGFYTSPQAP